MSAISSASAAIGTVLPCGGIGCSLRMRAMCTTLCAIQLAVLSVYGCLSPPASMNDGPGPASPTQYVSAFGGIVKPRWVMLKSVVSADACAPSSLPVTTTPPTLLYIGYWPTSLVEL